MRRAFLQAVGDDVASATLFGAVAWDAIHPSGAQGPSDLLGQMEASQQSLRQHLGDATFDELVEQGKQMNFDELGSFAAEHLNQGEMGPV